MTEWIDLPDKPGAYWYLEPGREPVIRVVEYMDDILCVLKPGDDWELELEDYRGLPAMWALITPPSIGALATLAAEID